MKNLKPISFLIAAIWTAIMVFAVIHNNSNKRFTVTNFHQTEIQAGAYKVDISPALAWDAAKGFSRALGWFFLAITWVAFAFVAADLHLKFAGDEKSNLGLYLIFSPICLSVIFFLANYSSIQSNNYKEVSEQQFNSWEQERKIEQKGEKTWVDKSDDKVLEHLFDGKKIIR